MLLAILGNLGEFFSVDTSSYKIIPKMIMIPKNKTSIVNIVMIAGKRKSNVTVHDT